MIGEDNLSILIKNMRPLLNAGAYVFCSIPNQSIDFEHILFHFKEKEGTTIVCTQEYAELKNYTFSSVFAWITLEIHSALEATGLTAAFSTALAQHQISCNVVAGFYHDHIFVPIEKATEAVKILRTLM
jgi:uncharacterized protein